VKKRALAQSRITINRLDKTLSNRFGIQAEEPGELPHAFPMRQADDDGAPIGWH
jgi:hypothetical protein